MAPIIVRVSRPGRRRAAPAPQKTAPAPQNTGLSPQRPVLRGALLAALGLLVGPRAWATNITTCPFTISTSGDYHVTQDLSCPTGGRSTAITVNANNVTLSLDGHTITGPGRTQFSAVAIDVTGHSGVQISNGTIASFGVGVELEEGTTGSSVSGLTITDCDDGIDLDFDANGNTVSGNTITSGDVGVAVGGSSNHVSGNTSSNNETGISINDDTAHGNVVEGNTALGNSSVDLEDVNANCDSNTWMGNCFVTESQSCIGSPSCGAAVQITCPPNQTVTAAAGQTSAVVAVGTASASPAGLTVVGVRSDAKPLTDPFPIGATSIQWTAMDAAGHHAACTQTITVQPASGPSPPDIACPGNKSVTAAAGQGAASVAVGAATSSTPNALIVGVRSDGKALTDPFPVGVSTTITWTVTDPETQLQSTCTQTVTVQAAPSTPAIIRGPNQADPHLDSIIVDRGPLYQRAILHGRGFADVQGTSIVTLGGNQIPVLDWTNDAIDVLINPLAYQQDALALNAAYPVQVVINANGKKSNTVDFFITDGPPPDYPVIVVAGAGDQPVFSAFQASLFCPEAPVSFLGSGFGAAEGSGFVSVSVPLADPSGNVVRQEFAEPVLGWSENAIRFILDLPPAAVPGTYTATVHRSNGKTASGSFLVGTQGKSGPCVAAPPTTH